MPTIIFVHPDGAQYPVKVCAGTTLMEAARDNGVPGIDGDCGGACSCATCHVYVQPEWLKATGEIGDVERTLLELTAEVGEGSRLSCQIDLTDDMEGMIVRLPEAQGY